MKTDKEKIEDILSLLTDRNIFDLVDDGQLAGEEERFGAMVFASYAFRSALKISESK